MAETTDAPSPPVMNMPSLRPSSRGDVPSPSATTTVNRAASPAPPPSPSSSLQAVTTGIAATMASKAAALSEYMVFFIIKHLYAPKRS